MKTILATLALFFCSLAFPAFAQTNALPADSFVLVTNLWYQGYKTNVLAIAEQRLAANSNDIAAVFLKLEYDIEFIRTNDVERSIAKLLRLANCATNANIAKYRDEIITGYSLFRNFLLNDYHPSAEVLEQDRQKGFLNHKPFSSERYLKALHDDGLF